jgi:IPTL-CTERM motif
MLGTDTIVASIGDTDIESNTVETTWVLPPRRVPTLSEWGLIAMAGVLGIVGFMVMRRRKVIA